MFSTKISELCQLAEDLSPDNISPNDYQKLHTILKLLNKAPSSTTNTGECTTAIFEDVNLYKTQASSHTHINFFAMLATGTSHKSLAAREDKVFKQLFGEYWGFNQNW
ncbi:hypothetical protein H0H87_000835, partial [Tephrocybe sp. NHM501043]